MIKVSTLSHGHSSTLDKHKEQKVPPCLFHFTSSNSLIGIVEKRALFSTHIAFMNDLGERRYGLDIVRSVVRRMLEVSNISIHEKEFLNDIKRKTQNLTTMAQEHL
jgi:hypothetical protein